jgi:hypothetical protein
MPIRNNWQIAIKACSLVDLKKEYATNIASTKAYGGKGSPKLFSSMTMQKKAA